MCSLSMNRISVITLFKIQILLQISVVLAHIQVAFTACRAWIPFSMPCKWSLSFFLSLKYYFRKKEHVLYLLYFNFAQLLWETASFSFIKDLLLSLSLICTHLHVFLDSMPLMVIGVPTCLNVWVNSASLRSGQLLWFDWYNAIYSAFFEFCAFWHVLRFSVDSIKKGKSSSWCTFSVKVH